MGTENQPKRRLNEEMIGAVHIGAMCMNNDQSEFGAWLGGMNALLSLLGYEPPKEMVGNPYGALRGLQAIYEDWKRRQGSEQADNPLRSILRVKVLELLEREKHENTCP